MFAQAGASVMGRQTLDAGEGPWSDAGVVDEIRFHLFPLLLSSGTRLFDHIGPERLAVEKTRVIEAAVATHLTSRVNNRPARNSADRDQTASS